MTERARKRERAAQLVFLIAAMLWLTGSIAIVGWVICHDPVTVNGVKQ